MAHTVYGYSDGKTQKFIYLPHPLGVSCGKITVDRNDVNAFTRKSVEIHGKRSDERLSFSRHHLCDPSLMKSDAAYDLLVIMHHSERSPRRFANRAESLGKQRIETLSLVASCLELLRLSL